MFFLFCYQHSKRISTFNHQKLIAKATGNRAGRKKEAGSSLPTNLFQRGAVKFTGGFFIAVHYEGRIALYSYKWTCFCWVGGDFFTNRLVYRNPLKANEYNGDGLRCHRCSSFSLTEPAMNNLHVFCRMSVWQNDATSTLW